MKILHFEGAHTKILADAKVEDLLVDPLITLHTESTVDSNRYKFFIRILASLIFYIIISDFQIQESNKLDS